MVYLISRLSMFALRCTSWGIVRLSVRIDGLYVHCRPSGISWYLTWINPDDTTSGRKVDSTVACLDDTWQRPDLFRCAHQSIEIIEPFDSHGVAMVCKSTLYFIGFNVHYAGKAVQPHISVRVARDTRDTLQGFHIR